MITQIVLPDFKQLAFILHEQGARKYHWKGSGLLSIKSFHGTALYDTGLGKIEIDSNHYLILNHGQTYSITVDSRTPVESFCIFFREELSQDVYANLTYSNEYLLENLDLGKDESTTFVERAYPNDFDVTPLMNQIKNSAGRSDHAWLLEQLHSLMQKMYQVHIKTRAEINNLKAARFATREELYRRLYRAVDFAAASMSTRVTLMEMAQAACLSPNHFLRSFKQLFHETPHQYVTKLRLERARQLLSETKKTISQICSETGFESHGSFSWLFTRHSGVSPREYRKQNS